MPVLVLVSVLYVFLATAGTFGELPEPSDGYDRMAEGFRAGHLYLQETPPKELLEAEDPYADKVALLGLWDASLYGGRYYYYWGPVPALLVVAYKGISGSAATVSDLWLTLLFMLGRFYGGAALILALCRLRAISPPTWLIVLAVAVFGLSGPAPFIVARPQVYEACLAAGQCFLVWGLWAAFRGLYTGRRTKWFALAGCLFGLAMGSRVTNWLAVPSVLAITLATSWWQSRDSGSPWRRTLLRDALALGTPVACVAIAYAAYNHARFGSFSEFGAKYQITLQKFWWHESFVLPNILSYLWAPLDWSCRFPFASAPTSRNPPFLVGHWPPGYEIWEKVAGVLVMAPWCYFLIASVVRLMICAWGRATRFGSPSALSIAPLELWAISCSLAAMPTIVPALGLWEASMRYSGDPLGGAVIGATLGAFWLVRLTNAADGLIRQQVRGLVIAAGAYTCLIGTFSAFASYFDPFKHQNPELYQKLESSLSLCEAEKR
ncbi:MAG TPA: hypothetical protein VG937_03560 [Polyangiaceae bacterium]|nr:hypothetical protein [Polyangiaceae bacterium]